VWADSGHGLEVDFKRGQVDHEAFAVVLRFDNKKQDMPGFPLRRSCPASSLPASNPPDPQGVGRDGLA